MTPIPKQSTSVAFRAAVRVPGRFGSHRPEILRFLKYALGQALSVGLDLAIFACLLTLTTPAALANMVSKLGSALFSFAFHDRVTFDKDRAFGRRRSALRYLGVLAINIALSTGCLTIAIRVWPSISKVFLKLSVEVVCFLLTFILVRSLVFPGRQLR